jgi:hypothetical protein
MKLMALTHKSTLIKPREGRTIAVSGDVYRFLAVGDDTEGKYALWETVVPSGGGPSPHVHRHSMKVLHSRADDERGN